MCCYIFLDIFFSKHTQCNGFLPLLSIIFIFPLGSTRLNQVRTDVWRFLEWNLLVYCQPVYRSVYPSGLYDGWYSNIYNPKKIKKNVQSKYTNLCIQIYELLYIILFSLDKTTYIMINLFSSDWCFIMFWSIFINFINCYTYIY